MNEILAFPEKPQKRAPHSINRTKFMDDREWKNAESSLRAAVLKYRADRTRWGIGREEKALALLMLLRTGARACELLRVRRTDIFVETCSVFLRAAKGSRDREIPIPEWLMEMIVSYANRTENPERLFKTGYKVLWRAWQFHRPVRKNLHSLRHTFAINVLKKTSDVKLVQTALGHRHLSSTEVYLDYLHSLRELKRVIF